MSKSNGSYDGAAAASRGYSSPGIIRDSPAASEMSSAWSSGRGVSEVSGNQSAGALYVNSHGGRHWIVCWQTHSASNICYPFLSFQMNGSWQIVSMDIATTSPYPK